MSALLSLLVAALIVLAAATVCGHISHPEHARKARR